MQPLKISPDFTSKARVQEIADDFVCPIHANEDRVLVRVMPPMQETEKGFWIPEDLNRPLSAGKVMAVGPNVKYIGQGWKVLFPATAGYEFTYDKIDYRVIRANDISAWE